VRCGEGITTLKKSNLHYASNNILFREWGFFILWAENQLG